MLVLELDWGGGDLDLDDKRGFGGGGLVSEGGGERWCSFYSRNI